MTERTCSTHNPSMRSVLVSAEDAAMIKKVHQILDTGKNVEIKQDTTGKPKVYKVSKQIA